MPKTKCIWSISSYVIPWNKFPTLDGPRRANFHFEKWMPPPRRRVLISAQPPVPPPPPPFRCPSPPPILSDHLTQTHTHKHAHKHLHTHIYIHLYASETSFGTRAKECYTKAIVFSIILMVLYTQRTCWQRVPRCIVVLMVLYTNQLSPGVTALVAGFWHQRP